MSLNQSPDGNYHSFSVRRGEKNLMRTSREMKSPD